MKEEVRYLAQVLRAKTGLGLYELLKAALLEWAEVRGIDIPPYGRIGKDFKLGPRERWVLGYVSGRAVVGFWELRKVFPGRVDYLKRVLRRLERLGLVRIAGELIWDTRVDRGLVGLVMEGMHPSQSPREAELIAYIKKKGGRVKRAELLAKFGTWAEPVIRRFAKRGFMGYGGGEVWLEEKDWRVYLGDGWWAEFLRFLDEKPEPSWAELEERFGPEVHVMAVVLHKLGLVSFTGSGLKLQE